MRKFTLFVYTLFIIKLGQRTALQMEILTESNRLVLCVFALNMREREIQLKMQSRRRDWERRRRIEGGRHRQTDKQTDREKQTDDGPMKDLERKE